MKHESSIIAQNLDLLISLTKDFEGFGLSLAEALAVKTPVLATKVGGVTEFLNKKNSVLIKNHNQQKICIELKDFAKNYKKWKLKASAGQKLSSTNFLPIKCQKFF